MGAREWYLSCPAVSQISNFTVTSSTHTVCVRKAAENKHALNSFTLQFFLSVLLTEVVSTLLKLKCQILKQAQNFSNFYCYLMSIHIFFKMSCRNQSRRIANSVNNYNLVISRRKIITFYIFNDEGFYDASMHTKYIFESQKSNFK